MHKALFYEKKEKFIQCYLCPHNCKIPENKKGVCAVRENIDGELYTLVYGKAIAYHIDPVEKKPLFHFLPGSHIYSVGTVGCNMKCEFCQNWQISQSSKGKQGSISGIDMSPRDVVKNAIANNCHSIALTYNEPTIFFEYALDICKEAKKHNLKTVFVSNGFINKVPIGEISKYLDAINIDIKAFDDNFYKKICGASLQPVLDAVKQYHRNKVWIEITTLVVPGQNDSEKELSEIAEFIAFVDKNIPWHVSAFHPDYKMLDSESTPLQTLEKAYDIGKKSDLNYVYTGNVMRGRENTYCPNCKKPIIKRIIYNIVENNVKKGKCKFCNYDITGVFN